MPGVVTQEANLGEHDRQEHGYRKLPPRVAHQRESSPPRGEQHSGDRDLPGVVPRAPVQQPCPPDLPGQLGILAAAPRGW